MKYTALNETPPGFYGEIGFMSGLEIHQQLLTAKKLFCRCPAGVYGTRCDAEILRHMRPTLSELGEYDGTALMEFKTKKEITYRINNNTVCTYEFDDTPPFMINEEALDIALVVAAQLNLNLVSEIHIARKQYLDGSIPTGFQRTTIVGIEGWIPYKDRKIRIRQLGLEEDSCRQVSDRGHRRVYVTDRLGMPLIETVTYPELLDPWAVAEVAEILRRLSRATGLVRTGAGAARQDVNVSVRGGTRCEIKGVASIRLIPALVHNEAFRQLGLLEIKQALKERRIDRDNFSAETFTVGDGDADSFMLPVREAFGAGRQVRAVLLRGYGGLLGYPVGPGKNFLGEISDRVRVIACIDAMPNVAGTDRPNETLYPMMWKDVRELAGAKDNDAVVLVWGDRADIDTATKEIVIRAREAIDGVPGETRQWLPDGTTIFERILPGPDRMYPDTDLPPKPVHENRIERAKRLVPVPPWERDERLKAAGISENLRNLIATSRFCDVFQKVVDTMGIEPGFAATLLTRDVRELRRKGFDVGRLNKAFLIELFELVREKKVLPCAAKIVLRRYLKSGTGSPEELSAKFRLFPAAVDEIAAAVAHAADTVAQRTFANAAAKINYATGQAMYRLRGRVYGKDIKRAVETRLNPEGLP